MIVYESGSLYHAIKYKIEFDKFLVYLHDQVW